MALGTVPIAPEDLVDIATGRHQDQLRGAAPAGGTCSRFHPQYNDIPTVSFVNSHLDIVPIAIVYPSKSWVLGYKHTLSQNSESGSSMNSQSSFESAVARDLVVPPTS